MRPCIPIVFSVLILMIYSVSSTGETESNLVQVDKSFYARDQQYRDLRNLEKLEVELATDYYRLEDKSVMGTQAIVIQIKSMISELSADEVKLLEDPREAKKAAAENPYSKIASLLNFIESSGDTLKSFHDNYDSYNDQKFDYMINRYRNFIDEVMEDLKDKKISRKRLARLAKRREELETFHKEYFENKGNLGTQNDRGRGQNYRRFFWTMNDFLRTAGRPHRKFSDYIALIADGFRNIFKMRGGSALRMGPALFVAAPWLSSLYHKLNRGSGIVKAMSKPIGAIARLTGAEMNISGRHNILRNSGPKVINVYAGMHPHSLYDLAAMTSLGIEKPIILTALAPKQIRDNLIESDEFVLVKQEGENPVDRIIEIVKEKQGGNLIIYPEGMMNLWGYETRPAQKNFVTLIKLLKRKGYEVNVIPISQPDNYQLGETQGPGGGPLDTRHLTTFVEPVIPADVVDLVIKFGSDKQMLSRMIRQQWIRTTHESGNPFARVAGMPHVKTWQWAVDREKSTRARCDYFFNAINHRPQ